MVFISQENKGYFVDFCEIVPETNTGRLVEDTKVIG